jgi:putative transposase
MPRRERHAAGGYAYHVLNRAVGRATLFRKPTDQDAFLRVLAEAREHADVPLLGFCLMPNHWHLVLRPVRDGDLSEFLRWLTVTHTQRWHAHYHTAGTGPVYQGRFKSFPIQEDEHLLTVLRYVERNALRAGLVTRAEHWRWGSLFLRRSASPEGLVLAEPPAGLPPRWCAWVNEPQTEAELAALRNAVARGCPFGDDGWVGRTAEALGLQSSLRPRGRPRKRELVPEGQRVGGAPRQTGR